MAKKIAPQLAWDDTPDEAACRVTVRLVRTPKDRDLKVILISDDFIGCRVHWIGRTMPCLKAGCPHCAEKKELRWRGYIFAQISGTNENVLVEFPAPAGKQLDAEFKRFNTLKGVTVVFSRPSKRTNGKVHVKSLGLHPQHNLIPKAPSIHEACALIWGVNRIPPMPTGGMEAQDVSEKELHEREAGKASAGHKNRFATKSCLADLAEPGGTTTVGELLSVVTQINKPETDSIKRVNGHSRKGGM